MMTLSLSRGLVHITWIYLQGGNKEDIESHQQAKYVKRKKNDMMLVSAFLHYLIHTTVSLFIMHILLPS